MKKLLSSLLCLVLVLCLVQPLQAAAEERTLELKNAEDFLEFAENCRLDSYSHSLTVTLSADIDLTGLDFAGIPVFCGSFQGNGHKITGLELTDAGARIGLFRTVTATGAIRDLTVEGKVSPAGSRAMTGGVVGSNAGLLENIHFRGTVVGTDRVGGIAGINTLTGAILCCTVEGTVQGKHFAGGIVGSSYGVVRDCKNSAAVNTTATQNTIDLSDITMETLTDTEAMYTVTDIGGIAGSNTGVLRACENRGDVGYRQMGYNVGGIAGSQSGYVTQCLNLGAVSGRKDVGGIAGQLVPVVMIDYSEDSLQQLQTQLNDVSTLAGQLSGSAQSGANSIQGQVSQLEDQTQTALEAIETLIPDPDNPTAPDPDTILAAQNALTGSLTAMSGAVQNITASAQSTASSLSSGLQALLNRLDSLGQSLETAPENLGFSLRDISDTDTEQDLTAKTESCENRGTVHADLNAGGIAGTISLESVLDPEQELQITGTVSLNSESALRCVILGCENSGSVAAGKQYAGGILGYQTMGLVKLCQNTGPVGEEGTDYAGGITGSAQGYIRQCSAKCRVTGSRYVGGIAGMAAVVTDCRSMNELAATEFSGFILGQSQSPQQATEDPIRDNLYLIHHQDLGAIDGISYDGLAQGLDRESFLALENIPEMFTTVTVTFIQEDGTEIPVSLPLGAALPSDKIPQVTPKAGWDASWEGLSQADLSAIHFDMVFRPLYRAHNVTIGSDLLLEGRPVLLVQGDFDLTARVAVTECATPPSIAEDQQLLGCHSFRVEGGTVRSLRYRIPAHAYEARLVLLVLDENGSWQECAYTRSDSYLVVSPDGPVAGLALLQEASPLWPWFAAGGALILLLGVLTAILLRRVILKRQNCPQPACPSDKGPES